MFIHWSKLENSGSVSFVFDFESSVTTGTQSLRKKLHCLGRLKSDHWNKRLRKRRKRTCHQRQTLVEQNQFGVLVHPLVNFKGYFLLYVSEKAICDLFLLNPQFVVSHIIITQMVDFLICDHHIQF